MGVAHSNNANGSSPYDSQSEQAQDAKARRGKFIRVIRGARAH